MLARAGANHASWASRRGPTIAVCPAHARSARLRVGEWTQVVQQLGVYPGIRCVMRIVANCGDLMLLPQRAALMDGVPRVRAVNPLHP